MGPGGVLATIKVTSSELLATYFTFYRRGSLKESEQKD